MRFLLLVYLISFVYCRTQDFICPLHIKTKTIDQEILNNLKWKKQTILKYNTTGLDSFDAYRIKLRLNSINLNLKTNAQSFFECLNGIEQSLASAQSSKDIDADKIIADIKYIFNDFSNYTEMILHKVFNLIQVPMLEQSLEKINNSPHLKEIMKAALKTIPERKSELSAFSYIMTNTQNIHYQFDYQYLLLDMIYIEAFKIFPITTSLNGLGQYLVQQLESVQTLSNTIESLSGDLTLDNQLIQTFKTNMRKLGQSSCELWFNYLDTIHHINHMKSTITDKKFNMKIQPIWYNLNPKTITDNMSTIKEFLEINAKVLRKHLKQIEKNEFTEPIRNKSRKKKRKMITAPEIEKAYDSYINFPYRTGSKYLEDQPVSKSKTIPRRHSFVYGEKIFTEEERQNNVFYLDFDFDEQYARWSDKQYHNYINNLT